MPETGWICICSWCVLSMRLVSGRLLVSLLYLHEAMRVGRMGASCWQQA